MKFLLWNQLADPLPDGAISPTASSDCGWECVAMLVAAYRDLDFAAACLRQSALIPATEWGSRAGELTRTLKGFRIDSRVTSWSPESMATWLRGSIMRGQPCIVLGRWLDPHVLHWVLACGINGQQVIVNDPYGGSRRTLNPVDIKGRAEGTIVQVREKFPK